MQTLAVVGIEPPKAATRGWTRLLKVSSFQPLIRAFQLEVSMDFDPRWPDDPRDRVDRGRELSQGSRGGLSNPRGRPPLDTRDVFTRDLVLRRRPN
jgi:hypothetical protein